MREETAPNTWTKPSRSSATATSGSGELRTAGCRGRHRTLPALVARVRLKLSPGLVRGEYQRDHGVQWKPAKAGAEFETSPMRLSPARRSPVRLRQMQASWPHRFTASERWDKHGSFALRLLLRSDRPLRDPRLGDGRWRPLPSRPRDEPRGIQIKARRRGEGPARWQFAAMHLSHAEIALKIDTKDVLTLPDKDSGPPIAPSDSYYDVLVPRRVVEVRNRARMDKAKSKEARP